MKTRSILLYVPAVPFSLEALTPQRELALALSALTESGQNVEVWDYGTLDELALAQHCQQTVPRRTLRLWGADTGDAGLQTFRNQRRDRILERIEREPGLQMVALLVETRADLREAAQLSDLIRRVAPRLRQVLFGRYARRFHQFLATHGSWDAVCGSSGISPLPEVAWHCNAPERWAGITGLSSRFFTGGPREHGRRSFQVAQPLPEYAEACYPAVHGYQKFQLFTISGAGTSHPSYYTPTPLLAAGAVATARQFQDEIRWLQQSLGAGIFAFRGRLREQELALGIPACRVRGAEMCFGVEAEIEALDENSGKLLAGSGCASVSVVLDSGSQRQLDEHFGRRFGVSRAEAIIRSLRAAGLFVQARFQFPCAADDYHSRAESVRLARRSGLCAVEVVAPAIYPGSAWRQRPEDFGFVLNARKYAQWCRASGRKESDSGYQLKGWSESAVRKERGRLLAELEEAGIWETGEPLAALLGRATGHAGSEKLYSAVLTRRLHLLDVEGLYAMIRDFNERALLKPNTGMHTQRAAVQAAVGN